MSQDIDDEIERYDQELLVETFSGKCCACGGDRAWNIVMLNRKCPTPGKGWGCLKCGLPMDYAMAVLCDTCLEVGTEIKFVCTENPANDGRTPIEEAPAVKVRHNYLYHPELWENMTWFDDSPEYGLPECICSLCGDQIPAWPEEEDYDYNSPPALRLFKPASAEHPHGQEARFCVGCVQVVLKYGQFV